MNQLPHRLQSPTGKRGLKDLTSFQDYDCQWRVQLRISQISVRHRRLYADRLVMALRWP